MKLDLHILINIKPQNNYDVLYALYDADGIALRKRRITYKAHTPQDIVVDLLNDIKPTLNDTS
jgi:hypothetical protein